MYTNCPPMLFPPKNKEKNATVSEMATATATEAVIL
jgi:hypothetical protein